jgi:hypothetical protein
LYVFYSNKAKKSTLKTIFALKNHKSKINIPA